MSHSTDVLIIGAGVTGLTTAYHLRHTDLDITILEARERIGGRTLSVRTQAGAGPFDLGAAWAWSNHPYVRRLAEELGINIFLEFETGDHIIDAGPLVPIQRAPAPDNEHYTYRFEGGAQLICDRLSACLPENIIRLNHPVQTIHQQGDFIAVATRAGHRFQARYVIVTLPPQLALHALAYEPALPDPLQQAMGGTQTWMGHAMKVVLSYQRPFWRDHGLSGIGVSFEGPVFRFHDATTADHTHAALFGWVAENHPVRTDARADREAAIVSQLVRMFGAEAEKPKAYFECDWTCESYTTVPEEGGLPPGATMYGHPLLQTPIMDGRLLWAGTETSPIHGGYLDGAVYSGEQTARKILAETGQQSG